MKQEHKKHKNIKSPPNIYNPSSDKANTNQSQIYTPPFCDVLPKGNHDSSEGGASGKAPLASSKSARKAATPLRKSNKSCPCVALTVRTMSNIVRIDEVKDVDGGGSTTVVGSTNDSIEGSPKGGARDASPVEDST